MGQERLSFGNRLISSGGDAYIVAQVALERFALIGLDSGNRWVDPVDTLKKLTSIAIQDGFKRM